MEISFDLPDSVVKKDRCLLYIRFEVSIILFINPIVLSSLSPEQVKEAIAHNDIATIQSVKGIGAKTAQRVILDLKDKVLKVYGIDEVSSTPSNTNKNEALSALETLGFTRKQADRICNQIIEKDPDATVETIIKLALKNL